MKLEIRNYQTEHFSTAKIVKKKKIFFFRKEFLFKMEMVLFDLLTCKKRLGYSISFSLIIRSLKTSVFITVELP